MLMLTAFSSICRFFAGVEFAPHALADLALVGSLHRGAEPAYFARVR